MKRILTVMATLALACGVVGSAQADPLTGCLLHVNRKLCEITGYNADELLGRSIVEITHPDDRQACWSGLLDLVAGKRDVYVSDKRYLRKNGEIVWVNVQVKALRDEVVAGTVKVADPMQLAK